MAENKNTENRSSEEEHPDHNGNGEFSAGEQNQQVAEADELRKNLDEAQKAAEGLKDQLLRKAAEFENYKRRSEADRLEFLRYANERLLESLLPILDDLHRSLKSGEEKKDFDAFYKGVELISAKFRRLLEAQGLSAFDSTGKPFDVDYHDALMQVPRDDVPPHTVVEEVDRGYTLHDKVLRHAKVIVSAAPQNPGNGASDAGTTSDEKKPV
jgi:molecular chaperone GrpE